MTYVVVGELPDGTPLPPLRVPAETFAEGRWLSRWEQYGAQITPAVAPPEIARAILELSNKPRRNLRLIPRYGVDRARRAANQLGQ